ncbi:hypothetical protein CC99x_004290 [Candidatus Berkiella cookevillensis]|uniref:Uncharacterized protein n=1 Tax=Candidatus Berkiella cookevillensis TaxID=437022 RepID=A0A0Q9YQN6_9GAMM|nr:hypothetical protein [Candidatus Berkiella cookevillensis]MCS5708118.1 hypothetical protein [Candidatus Berkiella cookevillensis]
MRSLKHTAIENGWLKAIYNHTCQIYSTAASEELFTAQKCGLQNPFTHPENITQHSGPYWDMLHYYLGVDYLQSVQNIATTLNVTAENCAEHFSENVQYATAGIADCVRSEEIATYVPSYQAIAGVAIGVTAVSLVALSLCKKNAPKKR